MRELAREVLTARGYAVVSAASPKEAMEICSEEEQRIDLVITDAVMPGMSGKQMAARLARSRPGMRILLMCGYTQPHLGKIHIGTHMTAFLQKPFTPGTLTQVVSQLLDQARN